MTAAYPEFLYTAQQSRDVDRCAIEQFGLPGPQLMARAARAAFDLLVDQEPEPAPVQILCGTGNNGGDGLLLAMLLQGRGIDVRVFLVAGEPKSVDAQQAAQRARSSGLELEDFDGLSLAPDGVVVDAMLGTGIAGAPRENYARAIEAVNALGQPVLALDVPSGVDSDTGNAAGPAIRATWTLSFITAKRGLYTAQGEVLGGERFLDSLAVPREAYAAAGSPCATLALDELRTLLPHREADTHKGHFGRLLVLGGDRGMGGAVILAAEAALRTGAGLVKAGTRPQHVSPLLSRRPECMAVAVNHRNDIAGLLSWADALVVGPGLGQEPWGEQLFQAALECQKPLLLDADGLVLLAANGQCKLPATSIITPHPGEAATLLGCSARDIQADRFAAARELASRFGAVVVLKGNGSLVCSGDEMALSGYGNPGMASGGMGDVLSGIGGALLAQGLEAWDAARLATAVHGAAADLAVRYQGMGALLASDVSDQLGELLP